jgi:glycosyltransferase involved in cell wall biosynthesis/predicted O-methyltransferase YrrM
VSHPRICIVAPEFIGPFPNGGVGTACYWEARTLGEAGYDVTVLYTGPTERETPDHWERHFAASAPFRYVDLMRDVSADAVERAASYEQPCAEARTSELVLAWLRQQQFALVLFQEFLGHGCRAVQAQCSGHALTETRTATTLHSCRQWIYEGMHRLPSGLQDVAVDFLEKESARRADRAIAPSRHMAEWAASRWQVSPPPSVLPYCYDETLARPGALVEHAGPFRHLVFFGRLETRKGLHLFCRALVETPSLRRQVNQVTFLGKSSSVDGLPSEAYIAAQMAQVPGVAWSIESGLGSFEAQEWLSRQANMLVVAPSLVDNLPYAIIELHTRRIPFVSTDIGGIPEIVGAANSHLLALPTVDALGARIARVCSDGALAVDYRDGFDVAQANRLHVEFVRDLLAHASRGVHAEPARFDVVVTNAANELELARVRARAAQTDPDLMRGRWMCHERWRRQRTTLPALFLDARVVPMPGLASRLLRALAQPGIDLATSYFVRDGGAVVAPLGGSLETGWRQNAFGGPCLAANPAAFAVLRSATVDGAFAYWPAYAGLACGKASIAIVPAPLYTVPAAAIGASGHAELEAVFRLYHALRPADLDLGWLLKSAFDGDRPSRDPGRALYDRMVSMPDDLLRAYAGLGDGAESPLIHDFAAVRERLASVIARWRDTGPRVFVYGAGQHTKLLLALCPELGQFIAGFIDRRASAPFLGLPCIRPADFHADMADAIVYSSREFEQDMFAGMRDAAVEHVLLYREAPPVPEASTTARLRARFGHRGADIAGLQSVFRLPKWTAGHISSGDAVFLAEMIAAHEPQAVVEIGVASGASSAAILHALDQLPQPEGRVLHSCDVRATCYFNDAYETGRACAEMYPSPRAHWSRDWASDAARLRRRLGPGSVDLTFIDANHSHPFPLLDLLHVTAFAKPGSWVVLHDIELPLKHPQYQIYGPRWLFQQWPFNKVKGVGKWTSIGAVQLPPDPAALMPLALDLLARPWEQAPARQEIALPGWFSPVQTALDARLDAARAASTAA